MKLLTPVNDYNLKVDISIENLQVVSTDCSGLTSLEIESVKNALIFVEFANKVKIEAMLSQNNLGITVVNIV